MLTAFIQSSSAMSLLTGDTESFTSWGMVATPLYGLRET